MREALSIVLGAVLTLAGQVTAQQSTAEVLGIFPAFEGGSVILAQGAEPYALQVEEESNSAK